MDILRSMGLGFGVGVSAASPANIFRGMRNAVDDDFLTRFQTLRHDEGLFSAMGYAAQSGLSALRGGFRSSMGMARGVFGGFGAIPGTGARLGYGAGVGLMMGGPILAGAAAFSGLNNIRRGRYGRAALQLAAGAGLVAAMYAADRRFNV